MISIYIYPATSGPAGPRQLLILSLLPLTIPLFTVPIVRSPAEAWGRRHGGAPPRTCVPKKKKEKNKTKTTARSQPQTHNPNPPCSLEAAPSSGPSLLAISCGGPWPPLLPFHLCLSPFFLLSSPVPRWDSDHLSYPRFTEEGQNRFGRSFAIEEQGHPGGSRVFPPAAFPHFFPELLDLGPPGLAVHEEMVAGLPLILTASPAPV